MLCRCEGPPVISPYETQTDSPEQAAYMAGPVNELWVQEKFCLTKFSVKLGPPHTCTYIFTHACVYIHALIYYTPTYLNTPTPHMHIARIHTHMHK